MSSTTASTALLTEPESEGHILPRSNIDRMISASLLKGAKSSGDSRIALQRLASEFIEFITSEADAISKNDSRRAITGDDLIAAMRALGLSRYADALAPLVVGLQSDMSHSVSTLASIGEDNYCTAARTKGKRALEIDDDSSSGCYKEFRRETYDLNDSILDELPHIGNDIYDSIHDDFLACIGQ